MMSAMQRSTPSLSVPPSQNTAPVFEHNCLFTHDIKRKQKRWNDGILRYHTFNRRIMVFDAAGNRVGDTHWTGSAVIQEGDEVTLEKWGVIVDVADCIRRTETDLSELRAAQARSTPARSMRTPSRAPETAAVPRQQPSQLKHRSLNSLLKNGANSPGGLYGSAKSPYELLHAGDENREWVGERPAKRQRNDSIAPHRAGIKSPSHPKITARESYLQTPKALIRSVTKPSGPAGLMGPPQMTPQKKVVVDLCDDDEAEPVDYAELWDSDSQASPKPPKGPNQHFGRNVPPTVHTTSLKQNSRRLATGIEIRNPSDRVIRPSKSKDARISSVADRERTMCQAVAEETIERREMGDELSPASRGPGTTLKMIATTSKKKRTLLCQGHLSQKTRVPIAVARSNRNIAAVLLDSTQDSDEEASSSGKRNDAPGEPLPEAQLTSIGRSTTTDSPKQKSASPNRPLDPVIQPSRDMSSVPDDHPRQPPVKVDKAAPSTLFCQGAATAKVPSFVAEKAATGVSDPLRKFKRKPSVVGTDTIQSRRQEIAIQEQPEAAPPKIVDPSPKDTGPWSREAFDLFVWRPPGWDEEKWSVMPG